MMSEMCDVEGVDTIAAHDFGHLTMATTPLTCALIRHPIHGPIETPLDAPMPQELGGPDVQSRYKPLGDVSGLDILDPGLSKLLHAELV